MSKKTRKVKALTGDEIVNAVAGWGVLGLDTDDVFEGSATETLMQVLRLETGEANEQALYARIHRMKKRLFVDDLNRLRLTSIEWVLVSIPHSWYRISRGWYRIK